MEMASYPQEYRDRFPPRMLSDISISSNSSAKAQNHSSVEHVRDRRTKLMCSYGGKILPRPSDRRLRYVGGETRMVSVPRHIQFEALLRKLTEIYGPDLTMKYQLPEEDLDALVSVTSDEDLENMMDECDRLDSLEGGSRLRVFVFPSRDVAAFDLNDMPDPSASELRYVDAVNTVQVESSFKKSNDSSTSLGHHAYGWNAPQTPHAESFQCNSSVPASDISGFPAPPPPPPPQFPPLVTHRQHTAPLEFISIQASDKGVYGGAGDDFRDLESGGSASSSTSSQHDLHHRLQWASRSQKQLLVDASLYGPQFQDSLVRGNAEDLRKKTEQLPIRNANKRNGAQNIRVVPPKQFPDEFIQLSKTEPAVDGEEVATGLHPGVPLSPGAMLQKQLEADRDSSNPNGVDMEPLKLYQKLPEPSAPFPAQAVDRSLDADEQMPDFLHTQLFEPLKSQQLLDRASDPAHLAIDMRQFDEAGKFKTTSQELTKGDSSNPNGVDMEPHKLYQKLPEPSAPFLAQAVDRSLDADEQMPDFLHTQLFEPLKSQQLPDRASDPAHLALDMRQSDEAGKLESTSQELTKRDALPMNLPTDFLQTDYPSVLYNIDDKERNDISIFASQPFSKEPYATVFQTCSSEIPLSGMDEEDELLQQELSPTMNFTGQMSMNDYHKGITSQAPWTSPGLGSFPVFQGSSSSTVELSSNAVGDMGTQTIGLPRTQDYDAVRGGLNELHMQGGERVSKLANIASTQPDLSNNALGHHMNSEAIGMPRTQIYEAALGLGGLHMQVGKVVDMDITSTQTGSLEEFITPDKDPGALPTSHPLDDFQIESPVGSNLASSLGSFGELNVKHKNPGLRHSHAAPGLTELSIDDSRDMFIGLQQATKSLEEPALQKGSVTEAEDNLTLAEEAMGSLTLESLSTTSPAAESLLEVWSTTAQSEHDTQSTVLQTLNEKKDIEEREGPASVMEKNMTIDDPKSDIDEFDTFQSAADNRSMNPAAAAEAEARARGLQIIRYCDLEELRELGSGTFGTVYHGKWRGTDVAIKRIKSSCFAGRPSERERLIADFWREAYILGQLHHPNVVAFYGVVPDGPGGTLATVTEYMVNGSLKQALQKKDRLLDRRKRLLIAMDVAFGMEYLHGKNVVHFDIKCENLLVNLRDLQRPICKVGDLGLSKVKQQTMVSGGVRGTLPWMAPELLNGSSSLVSEKVDVFSFGVVLWELLTGEEPYASMHYGAIIGGIVSNTLRPPVPRSCDPTYRSLMETCWSADPSERPSFSDIARRLRAMEAALNTKVQGQGHATV